jgi:DNA-directed RNA polymerase subunit RPC12/RpoP
MSDQEIQKLRAEGEVTHGLNCPNCGGIVPLPEGQVIVACPYCDLRVFVRGERGLQRYQVPLRVGREQAQQALGSFLRGSMAIARDVARKATLEDIFLAHLPFWASWARVFGWVFGQKQVGSGDNKRYEPREVRSVQEMTWNGVACDVGEFGVSEISLAGRSLDAFDSDALHASGMVFEPVGSQSDAKNAAEQSFSNRLRQSAKLDRISQVFERSIQERLGLVYYPLWVLRYLYRGRSFQVVVDGFSGEVLYGKAPGSTLYRAGMLVAGMALGALLAVDGSALAWYIALNANGDDSEGLFFGGIIALVAGFGIMAAAYRAYRYGEHYEFRRGAKGRGLRDLANFNQSAEDAIKWLDRLS